MCAYKIDDQTATAGLQFKRFSALKFQLPKFLALTTPNQQANSQSLTYCASNRLSVPGHILFPVFSLSRDLRHSLGWNSGLMPASLCQLALLLLLLLSLCPSCSEKLLLVCRFGRARQGSCIRTCPLSSRHLDLGGGAGSGKRLLGGLSSFVENNDV